MGASGTRVATAPAAASPAASAALPRRGPQVRELGLALPPARMPRFSRRRPLKRWRYVGVYTPELMLCVGDGLIGPVPQRWWALATPDGALAERTTIGRGGVKLAPGRIQVSARDVLIDLQVEEGAAVEIASPSDGGYIWTAKQGGVPARGTVSWAGREFPIDGAAFIDDSAGYHDRHTSWRWSAGVGRSRDGRPVAWNLVAGIHDSDTDSERTVWVDGEPAELPRADFADDLSAVTLAGGAGGLRFEEWSTREENVNMLLLRSRYRQPFGTFSGTLPGAGELAAGYGVMEEHDVYW